jgi:hypothetical protein
VYAQVETGCFAVIRAPQGAFDVTSLHLGDDYSFRTPSRQRFTGYPYLVFCITASPTRDDWFSIPELRLAYEDLRRAIKDGDRERARKQLAFFERTVRVSPDLLPADASKVVTRARERVDQVSAAALTGGGPVADIGELKSLDLYS